MKPVDLDEIYRTVPLEKIPWNMETPPAALVELVESGKVVPCRSVDLGCGAGNYALYLAGLGFDMVGIDLSPRAIEIAREKAWEKGLSCRFMAADLCGPLEEIKETFAFAYDWELLHHLYPEQREKYVQNVHRLLDRGGKYFSVCFSEEDPQFGGAGKYRETPLGTVLYFSSEDELRELFAPYFLIHELKTIEIAGKFAPHLAVSVFMEKGQAGG